MIYKLISKKHLPPKFKSLELSGTLAHKNPLLGFTSTKCNKIYNETSLKPTPSGSQNNVL